MKTTLYSLALTLALAMPALAQQHDMHGMAGMEEMHKMHGYMGRWTLDIPGGAGWLNVHHEKGYLDAELLWMGGSVLPVASAYEEHGKLVVTRTRDGGKTVESLSRGLPQELAYDLVYRHCLEISPDAGHLAFGSTTGSLWISDNLGDSWQTISTHLPPVLCVRFEN